MAADDERPIIIKKKKKGGHGGHHGGAWKVAYADFVTAMMAFFLLLWLLNATTEEQRNGIADYFSPTTVTQSQSGGGGMLQGQTMSEDGALTSDRAPVGINMRLPAAEPPRTPGRTPPEDTGEDDTRIDRLRDALAQQEKEQFTAAEEQLKQALQENPDLADLKEHLLIDQTPEGMRIQIVDAEGRSMFESGSAEPKPYTKKLLALVSDAIGDLPNDISIKGHTDAVPYSADNGYGNWELSSDRANASRRVLTGNGLEDSRISRVVGRADQDPLVPDDPNSARNRRVSIILLKQDHMAEAMRRAENAGPNDGLRRGPSILEDEDAG